MCKGLSEWYGPIKVTQTTHSSTPTFLGVCFVLALCYVITHYTFTISTSVFYKRFKGKRLKGKIHLLPANNKTKITCTHSFCISRLCANRNGRPLMSTGFAPMGKPELCFVTATLCCLSGASCTARDGHHLLSHEKQPIPFFISICNTGMALSWLNGGAICLNTTMKEPMTHPPPSRPLLLVYLSPFAPKQRGGVITPPPLPPPPCLHAGWCLASPYTPLYTGRRFHPPRSKHKANTNPWEPRTLPAVVDNAERYPGLAGSHTGARSAQLISEQFKDYADVWGRSADA